MFGALLVVTFGLALLCFRRLGVLLRREEETYAYLEARLEDRIRSGISESARSIHEETASSVASLCASLLSQLADERLALERKLETLARQVVDASRSSGEALDVIGRRTSHEAQCIRRELLDAHNSLHSTLAETLGEMRALQEQALRERQHPIRHAVAIRQEIRRARDQQAQQALAPPVGDSEVADTPRIEEVLDRILCPETAGR
jgi:hypothetical protein